MTSRIFIEISILLAILSVLGGCSSAPRFRDVPEQKSPPSVETTQQTGRADIIEAAERIQKTVSELVQLCPSEEDFDEDDEDE